MGPITLTPADDFSHRFLEPEDLPEGCDEYYLRNQQLGHNPEQYRRLRADELEVLVKNGNNAEDWDKVLVADPFRAKAVLNCEFAGLVRIGKLEKVMLTHHDLHVPAGLTHSRVINCDIGDNAAIHAVRYISHTIIGEQCILQSIDEMHTSNYAKFGNGIVKQREDESVRIWLDLMNEAGGRSVLPFDGLIPADAYLWAKYRGDTALLDRLKLITQQQFDAHRGYYGTIGAQSVIKSCRIIKDCKIGNAAYIKGANKLKNLTVHSDFDERTQIGEGVELVNGIIGYGCRIFYGCKAVRFVMGDNSSLKYGARLIHSVLGDNSTVSCCELLNNLVFPAHEQHHNNSFLVAALVMGQSNLAAGATIGSNHNSRANDGEVVAGRGFWPGLCTTVKHTSRFASFCLLAKGDYPSELNITLPFTLVSNDVANDRLILVPAYWWTHNMYALARNAGKFAKRDQRKRKTQHVEFDTLAPDTVEEIITGLDSLAQHTGRALLQQAGSHELELTTGHTALKNNDARLADTVVTIDNAEAGSRTAILRNPARSYAAYRQMLLHYAVRNLVDYLQATDDSTFQSMLEDLGTQPRQTEWTNLGGQLMPAYAVTDLRARIGAGELTSWDAIHEEYDRLWAQYPRQKQLHALATLRLLLGNDITNEQWDRALEESVNIQRFIRDQVYSTRAKDFENPYRQTTFADPAEQEAVAGTIEDNAFVQQVREETEAFESLIGSLKATS
ncbi:MAG: DUF4954 family protein [Phycisphaeraceae bacterium]|nr:DUF4954 family protein [Phycisphaeraceae bacterium]